MFFNIVKITGKHGVAFSKLCYMKIIPRGLFPITEETFQWSGDRQIMGVVVGGWGWLGEGRVRDEISCLFPLLQEALTAPSHLGLSKWISQSFKIITYISSFREYPKKYDINIFIFKINPIIQVPWSKMLFHPDFRMY